MNVKRNIGEQARREQRPTRGVCPLCERAFLLAQLRIHITKEQPKTRRQIAKAIRVDFPAWRTKDGACTQCWESFRGVVRVVDFMKKFKSATRNRRRKPSAVKSSERNCRSLSPRANEPS